MRTTFNLLLIIILCISLEAVGQKPTIVSVDKKNGSVKEIVTIKGSDFGTNPAKLKVFFGGAAGNIKEISDQLIEVQTPGGATYDNISVTNTTNGLTGYASQQFYINFNGEPGLTAANFSTQIDFQGESGLYDLCACDFNNDGKVDVATASKNSNSLSLFQNTSTPSNVTFSRTNSLLNAKTLHVTCGDLNGDGRPDIAVTENDGDRIFIYKNNGAFSFSIQLIKLTGKVLKRVAIADLDLDGKPDLIVNDQSSNGITILPNQSTLSSISFGTPVNTALTGATSGDALEIKDLNGDGLPEILSSQFNSRTSIFICENKSSPGNFNFNDIINIPLNDNLMNIKVGDLDGDNKPDIAVTRFVVGDLAVFLNKSTSSQISFSSVISTPIANKFPWGLDFGDLDGDGKTDIVVGSIDATTKGITVLNNTSTPGALSFNPAVRITPDFITRQPRLVDLDTDGKPDIIATSVDDNNAGVTSSKVSVFRNKSCFVPVVTPTGPLSVCVGFPIRLTSLISGGAGYDWKKDGSDVPGIGNPFLEITASGAYTVTASSEAGACTKTSNIVNITVSTPGAGLNAAPPDARSNSPVCTENALNLEVSNVGATEYRWRGPNGFTATGRTPVLNNFSLDNAGLYIVEMLAGSCVAKIDSTIVGGITNPDFTITFSGSSLICQGNPKTLTISPVLTSGFTYQWFEKALGSIGGATNNTFVAGGSGDYFAKVTSVNPGCAPVETPEIKLTLVAVPDAGFTSAGTGCVGQELTFANQSAVDPLATASYQWTFGDTSDPSTEASPKHAYTQPGTFAVKLSVTYQGGACPNEETKSISIVSAPTASITTPLGKFSICPSDTLRLVASGDIFTAFAWSTGETTPFIIINEPGGYFVNATNSSGCIMNASETVTAVAAPTVTAFAENNRIRVGEKTMLTATGLESYLWQPGLSLSDSTAANPVATPLQNITYTVSGRDINECYGEASVEITVLGSTPLNLITPSNFFSPNEDAINPYWIIKDIESFPQCEVSIFNDKGAKVFHAKPYANNWDGTFKGSNLPGGVYYYVIRCDGDAHVKTGSITLLK